MFVNYKPCTIQIMQWGIDFSKKENVIFHDYTCSDFELEISSWYTRK